MTKIGILKDIAIPKLGGVTIGFWSVRHITMDTINNQMILHICGWVDQESYEAKEPPAKFTQVLRNLDLDDLGLGDSSTYLQIGTALYTALLADPFFSGGEISTISEE